jgi:hypothetical protein
LKSKYFWYSVPKEFEKGKGIEQGCHYLPTGFILGQAGALLRRRKNCAGRSGRRLPQFKHGIAQRSSLPPFKHRMRPTIRLLLEVGSILFYRRNVCRSRRLEIVVDEKLLRRHIENRRNRTESGGRWLAVSRNLITSGQLIGAVDS